MKIIYLRIVISSINFSQSGCLKWYHVISQPHVTLSNGHYLLKKKRIMTHRFVILNLVFVIHLLSLGLFFDLPTGNMCLNFVRSPNALFFDHPILSIFLNAIFVNDTKLNLKTVLSVTVFQLLFQSYHRWVLELERIFL